MKRLFVVRRPSPAMAVATTALFLALGGTGYAAFSLPKNSVGTKQLKTGAVTTKKIKNRAVTAAKINATGLTVPNALQANNALTAGSATNATNATHATNADHATRADSAPLPSTLPSGETLVGNYYIDNKAAAANEYASDSISFEIPLASAPTPHVILKGGTAPAQCPGSVTNPQATPGNLCVYEGDSSNRTFVNVRNELTGADAADDPFGAGIWEYSAAAGESISGGTWAVTAP